MALEGCVYVTNLTALTQINTNIWKLRVIYIYVLTLIEINFKTELKKMKLNIINHYKHKWTKIHK